MGNGADAVLTPQRRDRGNLSPMAPNRRARNGGCPASIPAAVSRMKYAGSDRDNCTLERRASDCHTAAACRVGTPALSSALQDAYVRSSAFSLSSLASLQNINTGVANLSETAQRLTAKCVISGHI